MDYVKNLISVVIPCYNRVDVILPCIQSVLSQSYGDIEIIVADDGSTDGTEKLFDQLTDARIRYCRYTPNHGACRARNFGAQRARGEYIAFQDSDDYWHTDKLQKELSALLEWNADFVFCGMNRVSPDGKKYYYPVNPFDNSADALPQQGFHLVRRQQDRLLMILRLKLGIINASITRRNDQHCALAQPKRERLGNLRRFAPDT